MLALRTDDDFQRAPRDGYVFGEGWMYFCFGGREDVYGFAVWGTPAAEGIRALVQRLEKELERPPHAALVDARDVAWIEDAPAAARALDDARRLAEGVPVILRQLGDHLEAHVHDATIDHAARALTLSTRVAKRASGRARLRTPHAFFLAILRPRRGALAARHDGVLQLRV